MNTWLVILPRLTLHQALRVQSNAARQPIDQLLQPRSLVRSHGCILLKCQRFRQSWERGRTVA